MNEVEFFRQIILEHAKVTRRVRYRRLEIDFELGAPVALNHPWLYLDSIVFHLLWLNELKEVFYLLPQKLPISRLIRGLDLGPKPIRYARAGIPMCSAGRFLLEDGEEVPPAAWKHTKIYKRFEDRWAGGKRKINRGSGFFRDYMISQVYLPARKVRFWCVGDPEWLDEILQNLVSIGDNTRIGWGKVNGFQIREIAEDWSLVRDGLAMRPIPVEFCAEYEDVVPMAYKPAYWAPENVRPCVPPGARCKLSPIIFQKQGPKSG